MRRSLVLLTLVVGLLVGSTGCAIVTKGSGSWEVFYGVRSAQNSDEPASVGVESDVLERLIDNLTDGEVTEAE